MNRTLVCGTTFLLADPAGDVTGGVHGLFLADTRHLSRWELTVAGEPLRTLLARTDGTAHRAVLGPATRRGQDPAFTVFRTQAVHADGLAEELRVVSHVSTPSTVTVAVHAAADFADQFELRGTADYAKPGATLDTAARDGEVLFTYLRADFHRATVIRADRPLEFAAGTVSCELTLPPLGEATLTVAVTCERGPLQSAQAVAAAARADQDALCAGVPLPDIASPGLRATVERGLADLASLRVPVPGRLDLRVPGAGVPWFLTLYGRDSLITSLATLPYLPGLAEDTLRALASLQGAVVDPSRVEEPGKIPHEVRQDELSVFGQTPYGRYYGSVDSTPLFLVLLGRHQDVAGDAAAAESEAAARAAVDWMFRYGGLDEHAYLVYRTDSPGLVHQCWKDSAKSICFASGEPALGPIAVCEAQGYAYEALRQTARLARQVWHDPGYGDLLDARADRLRTDFLRDFWLPEQDFVALALDGAGRRVDALASNAGHVLWSGLLPTDRAEVVGRRLVTPEFFSGWGVRTLAEGQPAYHPLSYHNGGVWPHDTAIAVAGLASYGLTAPARMLADGLVAAAGHQNGHRLPEVMAGFARSEIDLPVPYPHSASPQAWAAAAALLVLTALGGD